MIGKKLDPKLFNLEHRSYYQLSAVIRHYGSDSNGITTIYFLLKIYSGHYITYRRAWHESLYKTQDKSQKFMKTTWSFTSDDSKFINRLLILDLPIETYIVSKEEVFDCPAYMLFYERIKENKTKDEIQLLENLI